MNQVAEKLSPGFKASSDLKCESCEDHSPRSIPGEAEALSALKDACAALKEVREIAERMDLSSLLGDTEHGCGENQSESDVKETNYSHQQTNVKFGTQELNSPSVGIMNESEGAVATEKLEIVASRIIRKYGRKSMRITLSAKADTPGKESEDKNSSAKAGISTCPPKENTPFVDSTSPAAERPTSENVKKKSWNFFKFLFGSRKRK